jgi:hypothetical protein
MNPVILDLFYGLNPPLPRSGTRGRASENSTVGRWVLAKIIVMNGEPFFQALLFGTAALSWQT